MKKRVWMNAWDLEGKDPGAMAGQLHAVGLDGCSLGLCYHGGRMLLGTHASRVVFEQPAGALYFPAEASRFPEGLRPEVPAAVSLRPFLEECARRGFEVQAWLVLCHNDALGARASECCVENAFGEKYPYALCPSNERVQRYCVELCRQAARVEGISALDLEALSFVGYEHNGLHEKRGIALPPAVSWWLSICCCPACRAGSGDVSGAIRQCVRSWLANPETEPEFGFDHVLAWRRHVQIQLLSRIRAEAAGMRLNVRLAQHAHFSGGKCTLALEDVQGLADEVTVTYFGASQDIMKAGLANIPRGSGVSVGAGFVFHGPDCTSEGDVLQRLQLVRAAEPAACGFYGYSMATAQHWRWLSRALERI